MRSTGPGTISIHFVHEVLQAVAGRGLPEQAMLQRAAIPPAFLGERLARISPEQFGAFWREVAHHLQDEFFALDRRPLRPGTYALLCHALLGTGDLRGVLEGLCRYTGVLLDGMRAHLALDGDTATIRLCDEQARATPFAHATCFMVMYGLACWLVAHRIPILQCRLGGQAPAFEAEYRVMFCAHLTFGATEAALVIPAALLSRPVVQTVQSLQPFLRRAPDVFLVKYRNTDSVAGQVRSWLRSIPPPQWPGLDAAASRLGMPASTFRRRLGEEGTSWQAIKNELRRDMAIAALREKSEPVDHLAHALGFAEAAAFHHAFKKWTGMRPSDYRVRPDPEGEAPRRSTPRP